MKSTRTKKRYDETTRAFHGPNAEKVGIALRKQIERVKKYG